MFDTLREFLDLVGRGNEVSEALLVPPSLPVLDIGSVQALGRVHIDTPHLLGYLSQTS